MAPAWACLPLSCSLWSVCLLLLLAAVGPAAGQDPDNNANGKLLPSAGNGMVFAWCDYNPDLVAQNPTNQTVTITMPNAQTGARIHTAKRYAYGNFSAMIKCPAGNLTGLVPNFYTSSGETAYVNPVQDEIDFEFLGKNKTQVQLNYYVHGNATGNELLVDLGFDCSDGFHEYKIDWTPIRIKWFVDGRLVRAAYNVTGKPYPTLPAFLYSSIWDASAIDNGNWAGTANNNADAPFLLQLANVSATELADKTFNDNVTSTLAPISVAPVPTAPESTPSITTRPVITVTNAPAVPPPFNNPFLGPTGKRSHVVVIMGLVVTSLALASIVGCFIAAVIRQKRAFAPSSHSAFDDVEGNAGEPINANGEVAPPASWLHRLSLPRDLLSFSRIAAPAPPRDRFKE